jgi:acyl dehydratase
MEHFTGKFWHASSKQSLTTDQTGKPTMRVFSTIEEIEAAVGQEIGTGDWVEITQDRVDQFAEATGDTQWIHVDVEKAATGPFGGTIAHGYLTLSLLPWLGSEVFALDTPGAKLNYGVNKVRFPNPVLVGSKVRVRVSIGGVVDIPAGRQLTLQYVIEIDGQDKPACVAETVVLLLG